MPGEVGRPTKKTDRVYLDMTGIKKAAKNISKYKIVGGRCPICNSSQR